MQLLTIYGKLVELHGLNGSIARVWEPRRANGITYHDLKDYHISKLFELNGTRLESKKLPIYLD